MVPYQHPLKSSTMFILHSVQGLVLKQPELAESRQVAAEQSLLHQGHRQEQTWTQWEPEGVTPALDKAMQSDPTYLSLWCRWPISHRGVMKIGRANGDLRGMFGCGVIKKYKTCPKIQLPARLLPLQKVTRSPSPGQVKPGLLYCSPSMLVWQNSFDLAQFCFSAWRHSWKAEIFRFWFSLCSYSHTLKQIHGRHASWARVKHPACSAHTGF